jgi:glycosyltransferase involved in cell wall biosynthesis
MKVSVVIPCLNGAPHLRECLQSLVSQPRECTEIIIVDGGSSDESLSIAGDFSGQIDHMRSSKDDGQYDAINKGFALSSGEIMGWLNADDLYLPWTIKTVVEIFSQCPEIQWLTSRFPTHASDKNGWPVSTYFIKDGPSRKDILGGLMTPGHRRCLGVLQQESTFWRRDLWDRAGSKLDTSYSLAADAELWLRFAKHADLCVAPVPLACFRIRPGQRSSVHAAMYKQQASDALLRSGVRRIGALQFSGRLVGAALNRRIAKALKLVNRVPHAQFDQTEGVWKVLWK